MNREDAGIALFGYIHEKYQDGTLTIGRIDLLVDTLLDDVLPQLLHDDARQRSEAGYSRGGTA